MTHLRHTLDDGTVVSAAPEHMAVVLKVEQDMRSERERWIADLRARGVKAAHPDDGWVRRTDDSSVHLVYPQFNDGLGVGDLLALGWPSETRIVRVTRVASSMFGLKHFHFDGVERLSASREAEAPPTQRRRWWWRGRNSAGR